LATSSASIAVAPKKTAHPAGITPGLAYSICGINKSEGSLIYFKLIDSYCLLFSLMPIDNIKDTFIDRLLVPFSLTLRWLKLD
jgi:hypothetical protein